MPRIGSQAAATSGGAEGASDGSSGRCESARRVGSQIGGKPAGASAVAAGDRRVTQTNPSAAGGLSGGASQIGSAGAGAGPGEDRSGPEGSAVEPGIGTGGQAARETCRAVHSG